MLHIIQHVQSQRERYLEELKAYLSIASISSDPDRTQEMLRAGEHTAGLLRKAGCGDVIVHRTEGHPIVTGSIIVDNTRPTVLIYGHYDVQPVDPLDLWERNPFEAHIKDDTIIARGSADDKGQVFMHFKAVEAFREMNETLPVNVKFVVEGEEEIASPNLVPFLEQNRDLLAADFALVSDTSMWAAGMPAITYGLRGLAYLEINVTGPSHDLHSGEFGGTVPNPAEVLARMLAKAKDDAGRIQIPGFYDKVETVTDEERKMLALPPYNDAEYKKDLGIRDHWGETGYSPVERTWIRPTFEVNGIWGGFTGTGAKTVLPSKASAKISMRLVPNQAPDEIADLVEAWIMGIAPGYVDVRVKRFAGGKPFVVPLDNPFLPAATRALEDSFGREPFLLRGGGSIPIVADFKRILGLDTLLAGFSLPNCRAHSPNENMHLPSFFTGIESLVRMMDYFGKVKR